MSKSSDITATLNAAQGFLCGVAIGLETHSVLYGVATFLALGVLANS